MPKLTKPQSKKLAKQRGKESARRKIEAIRKATEPEEEDEPPKKVKTETARESISKKVKDLFKGKKQKSSIAKKIRESKDAASAAKIAKKEVEKAAAAAKEAAR